MKLHVYGDTLEDIITELINDDYLNEERFARSYARGKFRIKSWGKIKITQHLKSKQVTDYCIRKGLEEIDEEAYIPTLITVLKRELKAKIEKKNRHELKEALYKKGIRQGYESHLVTENIRILLQDYFSED